LSFQNINYKNIFRLTWEEVGGKETNIEKIMKIAVDAAGGDFAPNEVIKGAILATEESDIEIILVGKKTLIHVTAARYIKKSGISIVDASQVIEGDEHPMKALMSKPDSSLVVGINLLKSGKADAFVSAGNTGALFGAALLNLGKVEGIERPAICTILDMSTGNPVVFLDAGANADCKPQFLLQFGKMGNSFSKRVMGIENPRVALLSNGSEETKGSKLVLESHELLKASGLNFIGNIEANDLIKGKADVVVTDGFTGNIVLKTLEGLGEAVQSFKELWKGIFKQYHVHGNTLVQSIGLDSWAKKLDFSEYGGACLLGVKGNVIKAHGRSHARAIKNAIHLARQTVAGNIFNAIVEEDKDGQNSSSE
jgi:phosphate acyltransferase